MNTGNADLELNFAQIAILYERFLQRYCDGCEVCQKLDKSEELPASTIQLQTSKKIEKERRLENAAATKAYLPSIADFGEYPSGPTFSRSQTSNIPQRYPSIRTTKPVLDSSTPCPPPSNALALDQHQPLSRPIPPPTTPNTY